MASLTNPTEQGGDGYYGQTTAAVSANQVVQLGPFSKSGGRLSPGIYQVTLTTVIAALQPETVQLFFGSHGEKLTGALVSMLPGTLERSASQIFHFGINPNGSISNPPNGSISNPPNNDHTIGSPDDKWQKVQSSGREIYVMTNGSYYTTENLSGSLSQSVDGKTRHGLNTVTTRKVYGFKTHIVANLPESTIVGAPQSVMNDVEGNCQTRTFHVLGSLFFAGKNRSGMAMENIPPEEFERKLVPSSPFEKAFDMLCTAVRDQAPSHQTTQSLGSPTPARSSAERSYGSSKEQFIGMGLCMACGDNVAQWYVQRPTSRCGMLAKNALEGHLDAVKELQTFPLYCTWQYK